MRRATTVILALACTLAATTSAQASYPGKNGQVVFSNNGDIWGVSPTGSGLHRITRDQSGSESQPGVSPNGRTLAFEYETPTHTAEIFTTDMKGKHALWVTKKLSKNHKANWLSFHEPSFSPNGKRIAFRCNNFNYNQICTISATGGSAKVLARCDCALGEPEWGKSNKIVFEHGLELWSVGASGGKAHKLPIAPLDNYDSYGYQHPSWAPDGKSIVFSVGDANTAVDIVDANGGNHRRILISPDFGQDPTDYDYPVWAPDGQSIALHVSNGRPEGLYTADLDGSNLLMRSPAMVGQYPQPFWAPKPR
jgi:Tol biopolymer transport system component